MEHTAPDRDLLLEAFDLFTKASSSLESAYRQLQQRAENLSVELAETNQKLKENLQEKERVKDYLNNILESLPCGVLVLDLKGEPTICNRLAAELLQLNPDYPTLGSHPLADFIRKSLRNYETNLRDVELSMDNRFFAVSSSRVQSKTGESVTFIIKDITDLKKLEEQTKRGERLSAMGEMAVELAHEIRNPLASIELFASLLRKEIEGDKAERWADHIQVGVRLLNNIVSNMLHFTRDLSPSFHPVDLHAVIDETLGFSEPVVRQRRIQILRDYSAHPATVRGDEGLLKQVFLNLIFNAMQAMPDNGSLQVSTRGRESGASMLEIKVKDDGVGIAAENLDKIFDPYFTTNKSGTGLGLAVVHRIIEKHSGIISVESRVNFGTTFTIALPLALRSELVAAHSGSRAPTPQGGC